MTRALLDVNVLLALLDPDHADHRAATDWIEDQDGGWASCAITENGFVRIVSQPRYPNPVTPRDAIDALAAATDSELCERWPCDVSLLDPGVIDRTRLHGHRQVTDAYLLGLAVAHGGRLATFDRSVVRSAVPAAGPDAIIVL